MRMTNNNRNNNNGIYDYQEHGIVLTKFKYESVNDDSVDLHCNLQIVLFGN